eukprot:342297_1
MSKKRENKRYATRSNTKIMVLTTRELKTLFYIYNPILHKEFTPITVDNIQYGYRPKTAEQLFDDCNYLQKISTIDAILELNSIPAMLFPYKINQETKKVETDILIELLKIPNTQPGFSLGRLTHEKVQDYDIVDLHSLQRCAISYELWNISSGNPTDLVLSGRGRNNDNQFDIKFVDLKKLDLEWEDQDRISFAQQYELKMGSYFSEPFLPSIRQIILKWDSKVIANILGDIQGMDTGIFKENVDALIERMKNDSLFCVNALKLKSFKKKKERKKK